MQQDELWHLPSIYTHDFHLIWITLPSVKLQYVLMDYISVLNAIYLQFLAFWGFLQVTTSAITRAIMMRSMITAPAAMPMITLRGIFMMAVVVVDAGNKVHVTGFMMHSLIAALHTDF